MQTRIYCLLLLVSIGFITCTKDENNPPAATITFKKTFGGTGQDLGIQSKQTSDGGYITVGSTNSKGAGEHDVYLIKTNQNGDLVWERTYGGAASDFGNGVLQTSDGGYIVVGTKNRPANSGSDMYVIRTDANGNVLWERIITGNPAETVSGYSIVQINNGGFAVIGDLAANFVNGGIYFVTLSSTGDVNFPSFFSEPVATLYGRSIQQTSDGGLIILGSISSLNGGLYLMKTTAYGDVIWKKTIPAEFGGAGYDVQQTKDGGYILIGDLNRAPAGSATNIYLVKTDANGNTSWETTFDSGNSLDSGTSVYQTSDEGYMLGGYGPGSAGNMQLIKTDKNGNLIWQKNEPGVCYSVEPTEDGGTIMTGFDGDLVLLKLDKDGNR